jgi:translation initiation factor 3 subunit F
MMRCILLLLTLLSRIVLINFSSQEGHVAPDNKIGKFISDAVGSLPKLPPSDFDKLVNDSLQVRLCSVLLCFTKWDLIFLQQM